MKRNTAIREALGFDDVLLVPAETNVKPDDVQTKTFLTKSIELGIPFISAGHDNVTESAMAIAIAQQGGIGVIHDNMPLGKQVEEVRRVKRAEGNMISTPITTSPDASVAEALDLMATYKISGLPVIEHGTQKVVGIITKRDLRFFEDYAKPVSDLMTKEVVTVKAGVSKEDAKRILHENRIEKLVLVDDQGRCAGMITVKDIEKLAHYSRAARDAKGCLRVGATVSIGKDAFDRTAAMTDAGLDAVFIDVAHAHNRDAIGTVSRIRQQRSSEVQIIAGNVATPDAARSLIDAGADAIKVGIGASMNTASRRQLGIGMPQLTAVLDVVEQCSMMGIPVIVDGGMCRSSSIIKALAAGAQSVVISDLFAGSEEAPGDVVYHEGKPYKIVNPAAKAQHRPQAASVIHDVYKMDDDIIDTSVPFRGSIHMLLKHLVKDLKTAMAYTGSRDIASFIENAVLVRTK